MAHDDSRLAGKRERAWERGFPSYRATDRIVDPVMPLQSLKMKRKTTSTWSVEELA